VRYLSREPLKAAFDDDDRSQHVDGIVLSPDQVDRGKEEDVMAIDGNWNVDMETPMGTQNAKLELVVAGTNLTGKMMGSGGAVEISDGRIDGNKASWKAKIKQPMPLTLQFSVTVDGNNMAGNVKLGIFANAPLKGTRA
jgi:hypothetical protein